MFQMGRRYRGTRGGGKLFAGIAAAAAPAAVFRGVQSCEADVVEKPWVERLWVEKLWVERLWLDDRRNLITWL
jgi:hypothetical protein